MNYRNSGEPLDPVADREGVGRNRGGARTKSNIAAAAPCRLIASHHRRVTSRFVGVRCAILLRGKRPQNELPEKEEPDAAAREATTFVGSVLVGGGRAVVCDQRGRGQSRTAPEPDPAAR